MPLRAFQLEGAAFLGANRHAILADDAGLGKTAQVLAAADSAKLARVLVIGPAAAGASWPDQVKRWSPGRAFVTLDTIGVFGLAMPGIYFLSYDIISLSSRRSLLTALKTCRPWDALILDEAQYCKSSLAQRTVNIYGRLLDPYAGAGVAQNANRVWLLSGTLTPNHAGEAYPHLRALFPDRLALVPAFAGRVPEQHEFENEFCVVRDTTYGRQIDGSKNIPVLRGVLAGAILRRLKRDVLRQLPPIEWFTAPLPIDRLAADRLIRPVLDIYIAETTGKVSASDLSDEQVIDMLAATPHFATARRELGILKARASAEWVIDRLEAGEPKVVVFAHHHDVIVRLTALLQAYDPVVLDGATPGKDRERVVRRFQQDPHCRVFIGQLQAAGTAITLSAAKTVFMAEWATTPGQNYQAACRCHRIGQRDGVQVYFGTVPGSLDDRITRTAERRAREISQLFD